MNILRAAIGDVQNGSDGNLLPSIPSDPKIDSLHKICGICEYMHASSGTMSLWQTKTAQSRRGGLWSWLGHCFVPRQGNHYQPHVLHHYSLVGISALLLVVKVLGLAAVEFTPALPTQAAPITQQAVLDITNSARAGAGQAVLKHSELLERAAQLKAEDMLIRQYFAHNTPDGKNPWYFFGLAGYSYQAAGENLAVHFYDTDPLQSAWMNSPGHRANILNPTYTEMGVGIARGIFEGFETVFVVEEFGAPLAEMSPQVATAAQEKPTAPVVVAAASPTAPIPAQAPGDATTLPNLGVQKPFKQAPPISSLKLLDRVRPTTASAANAEAAGQFTETASVPEPALIEQADLHLDPDGGLLVEIQASETAAKVLLFYGNKATLLRPRGEGVWQATLPLTAAMNQPMAALAADLQGNARTVELPGITRQLEGEVAAIAAIDPEQGWASRVKVLEQKAYLVILAFLLSCLLAVILVHRHIQHVRFLANTAFVAMLAALLLIV